MKGTRMAVMFAGLVLCASWSLSAEHAGRPERGERWKAELGLTDEQAAKLKDARTAEKEALKPLRRELRDALAKLSDQVEDKASDKDIQASLDRVDRARKALRDEQEKTRAKNAALLTPTQRAKMALAFAKRGRGRMEKGMKGRGGWMSHGHEREDGDDKR